MDDVADQFAAVQDLLGRMVAREGVQGAALAVSMDGATVFEQYEGVAVPGRPADASTLWDLASIGKAYTAATITALERLSKPVMGGFSSR